MKKHNGLFFILFILFQSYAFGQYDSIYFDGMYRTYQLHLPVDYEAGQNSPLIMALHGGFGSGTQLESQSQLSVKADEENFIVVYPEGVESLLNIRTWNAGGCCGYAAANDIDDVGFINALMDTLIADYSIDTLRIFATGMSNGAFMTYRLACELSNRIAAIAPVAGSMNVTDCSPINKLPVIHFHSYLDTSVPYQGGIGDGVSNHYNPPLDSVLNVWATTDNCQNLGDTLLDNEEYTHVVWNNCDCFYSIEYYITHDGGHSWPGGNQSPIGDPTSEFINANDLMWDFFQQFTLSCDQTIGIKETPPEKQHIKVYPNPTSGTFIIVGDKLRHVSIYSNEGTLLMDLDLHPSDMLNIDLSGENPGFYYVRVSFKENSEEVIKVLLK